MRSPAAAGENSRLFFCKRGKCEFTLGGIAVCFGFSKGASMSNTAFIESQSSDPFVRELSRRAVRILNDQSLDRRQREAHIHRLQARLVDHQAKQALVTGQKAAKAANKGRISPTERRSVMADQRQVLSLRKEFRPEEAVRQNVQAELNVVIPAAVAANDGYYPNRRRSVLTLKRA